MDRGKAAFRSTNQTPFDDRLFMSFDEPSETEETAEDRIATYASLADHPGWQLIKEDFMQTITTYRSGQAVKAAIERGDSDDKVGKLTRTANAVADELEKIILTVETAVAQMEEKRNGRSQPRLHRSN